MLPENTYNVLERFQRLRVWSGDGRRAPYKPLMILWAIGRCLSGKPRMTTFERTRAEMGELLTRFGPPQRRPTDTARYPFWRMQYDGVWEIDRPQLVGVTSSNNAHVSDLIRHRISGGANRIRLPRLAKRPSTGLADSPEPPRRALPGDHPRLYPRINWDKRTDSNG